MSIKGCGITFILGGVFLTFGINPIVVGTAMFVIGINLVWRANDASR